MVPQFDVQDVIDCIRNASGGQIQLREMDEKLNFNTAQEIIQSSENRQYFIVQSDGFVSLNHDLKKKLSLKLPLDQRKSLKDQQSKKDDLLVAARIVSATQMKTIVERVVKLLKEADGLSSLEIQRLYFEKYGERFDELRDSIEGKSKLQRLLSNRKEIKRMVTIMGRNRRLSSSNFEKSVSNDAQLADYLISYIAPWTQDDDDRWDSSSGVSTEDSSSVSAEDENEFLDSKVKVVPPSTSTATSPMSLLLPAQATYNTASSASPPISNITRKSLYLPVVLQNHRSSVADGMNLVPETTSSPVVYSAPPMVGPTLILTNGSPDQELWFHIFSTSRESFVRMNKGFSRNILANQRYIALDLEGFSKMNRNYSLAQVSLGDGNSAILFDRQQGKEAVHRTLLNSFLNAKDLQYIFIHDCHHDVTALSSSFVEELYRNNKCFIDTQLVYEFFHQNIYGGFNSCLEFFLPDKGKHETKDVVKKKMRSDPKYWFHRPLTLEQVQYAALDVILLERAIPSILEKIKVAGELAEVDLLSVFVRATEKRIANVFDGLNRTKLFNSETSQPVSSELAEALAQYSIQSFSSGAELLKPFSERNLSSAVPSKAISDSHERFKAAQIQITKLEQTNSKLTSELHSKNQECERLTAQLGSVLQRLAEAESKTNNSDEHFHHQQKLQIEDAINAIKCKDDDNNKHKYNASQVTVQHNIYSTFRLPHAAIAPPAQWYAPYYPAQVQVNSEFCALPGCRNIGPYTCAGCRKLSYCSAEHQRQVRSIQ